MEVPECIRGRRVVRRFSDAPAARRAQFAGRCEEIPSLGTIPTATQLALGISLAVPFRWAF